jgi:hypothetical protein
MNKRAQAKGTTIRLPKDGELARLSQYRESATAPTSDAAEQSKAGASVRDRVSGFTIITMIAATHARIAVMTT